MTRLTIDGNVFCGTRGEVRALAQVLRDYAARTVKEYQDEGRVGPRGFLAAADLLLWVLDKEEYDCQQYLERLKGTSS